MENKALFAAEADLSANFSKGQQVLLGLQHTLAMFGATVLVPLLTGLSVSVTLFSVGVGTLIFHFVTKFKVPAFLGSSFAFIAPLAACVTGMGVAYAQGGVIVAGIVYFIVGFAMQLLGDERVAQLFPPVVTGPIIMVIGLGLAPTGVKMASSNWTIALITLGTALIVNIFGKGLLKVIPVVIALVVGYSASIAFGLIDFSGVGQASLFGLPGFTLPKFSGNALLLVAPAAIVSCLEHIGDILAIGSTVDKDFRKDPGLPATFYGGGFATLVSGFLGGPSLTTYGENTGVLALTKVYATFVVSCGACWAIAMSFIPKVEAIIYTIPESVIGGISVLLYGMIAGIGVRTVVENQVNLMKTKNLLVASVILVLGIGGATINIGEVHVSSMVIAAVAGIVLNLVIPEKA